MASYGPTRMQRRIDNLLCPPYFWCHGFFLTMLIRGHEFLRVFKTRRGDEESSVRFNHQPFFLSKRRIAVYLPHQHLVRRSRVFSHLGSAISADCFTRPQYVLRSYWEAGRSRCPGREADMVAVQTLREQNTVRSKTPNCQTFDVMNQ